jgi:alanine-synthesizing transaminase
MFSKRTAWQQQTNRLTELAGRKRRIIDLTNSNPTACGLRYPLKELAGALSAAAKAPYAPDPHGLLSARKTVAGIYKNRRRQVDPEHLFITASTSEAYSLVFTLLCNAGERVLVPQPSYPLFEYLARINDVAVGFYRMVYDGEWHPDFESLGAAMTPDTRAVVIINPHNPTGWYLKENESREFRRIARAHGCAIISDEVFLDYPARRSQRNAGSTAGLFPDALTFTLDGISKMAGLPHYKLGWIAVSGPKRETAEACRRLEILCDTFLSPGTPVQAALQKLLSTGSKIRKEIRALTRTNLEAIIAEIPQKSPVSLYQSEGGWYAVLRVPSVMTEEEWAIRLLETAGVYVYPGYFFDFSGDGLLVLSLLVPARSFRTGIRRLLKCITSSLPKGRATG